MLNLSYKSYSYKPETNLELLMKLIYIIIILVIAATQLHSEEREYDFTLPCDTLTTQLDMNQCTSIKYNMIDSIVTKRYECLMSNLELKMNAAIVDKDDYQTNYFKKIIESLVISQYNWRQLSKSNMEIYHDIFKGGTVRPMMVSISAIQDGIQRLRRLDSLLENFGDTKEKRICE